MPGALAPTAYNWSKVGACAALYPIRLLVGQWVTCRLITIYPAKLRRLIDWFLAYEVARLTTDFKQCMLSTTIARPYRLSCWNKGPASRYWEASYAAFWGGKVKWRFKRMSAYKRYEREIRERQIEFCECICSKGRIPTSNSCTRYLHLTTLALPAGFLRVHL